LVEQTQQAFSLLGMSIARPDATDVAGARGWAAGTAPAHRIIMHGRRSNGTIGISG
jgi:hypothetical protein